LASGKGEGSRKLSGAIHRRYVHGPDSDRWNHNVRNFRAADSALVQAGFHPAAIDRMHRHDAHSIARTVVFLPGRIVIRDPVYPRIVPDSSDHAVDLQPGYTR